MLYGIDQNRWSLLKATARIFTPFYTKCSQNVLPNVVSELGARKSVPRDGDQRQIKNYGQPSRLMMWLTLPGRKRGRGVLICMPAVNLNGCF